MGATPRSARQRLSNPQLKSKEEGWKNTLRANSPAQGSKTVIDSSFSSSIRGKPRGLTWPNAKDFPQHASTQQRHLSPRRGGTKLEPFQSAACEDSVINALAEKGYLSTSSMPWPGDPAIVLNDLDHVGALFSSQMPDVHILRVLRVETSRLAAVHEAVKATMSVVNEQLLWHGTSPECVANIVLSGFNRAYCGRHGTKLGHGTYFSAAAEYSTRFCGRKSQRRVVILADVLVGSCTKGSPDLVEPPYCNADRLQRFDSTVDNVESPSIFCVFRDFQALPRYLVEFAGCAA
jgi:poly [ADP-ribose] polymerase 10/14/15